MEFFVYVCYEVEQVLLLLDEESTGSVSLHLLRPLGGRHALCAMKLRVFIPSTRVIAAVVHSIKCKGVAREHPFRNIWSLRPNFKQPV